MASRAKAPYDLIAQGGDEQPMAARRKPDRSTVAPVPSLGVIEPEVADVGRWIDPLSGLPIGHRSLSCTRRSAGMTDTLFKHAIPWALIGQPEHVGLRIAAPAAATGALIVYPVIDTGSPTAGVCHVVACRFKLFAYQSPWGEAGFPLIRSLIFKARDWELHAPELVPQLTAALEVSTSSTADPASWKRSAPRPRLTVGGSGRLSAGQLRSGQRPPSKTNALASERIADACHYGVSALLGREAFATEAEFLALLARTLATFPEAGRPLLSFSTGYTPRCRSGVGPLAEAPQIAYLADRSIDPSVPLAPRQTRQPARLQSNGLGSVASGGLALGLECRRMLVTVLSHSDGLIMTQPASAAPEAARRFENLAQRVRSAPWLAPHEVPLLLSCPELLASVTDALQRADLATVHRVQLTALLTRYATPSGAPVAEAFLASVRPFNARAATLTLPSLETVALLQVAVRAIDEIVVDPRLSAKDLTWLKRLRRALEAALMQRQGSVAFDRAIPPSRIAAPTKSSSGPSGRSARKSALPDARTAEKHASNVIELKPGRSHKRGV